MPTEHYWNCNQIKHGVELCPSEDRLCLDCHKANKRQLWDLKETTSNVAASGSASPVNSVAHRPHDKVYSSRGSKKLKAKQAKGREKKHDEIVAQQRPTIDDGDTNEQYTELSEHTVVTAATTDEELA
jgi:hypothetical protein